MSNYFQLIKMANGYNVVHANGVHMGTFEAGDDGYYVFWPIQRNGYWPGHLLVALGEALNELNADWDKEVKDALAKMPKH